LDYTGELTKDVTTRKDQLKLQTTFMDTQVDVMLTKS
jgi:hypothetical protein